MPDLDDPGAAREGTSDTSRRSVLRAAAGAGAAGIAATTLGSVLGGVAARASTRNDAQPERAAADTAQVSEPIVLHVRDAAAGEIDVFRGTAQTRLHDRDLAARIVRASR